MRTSVKNFNDWPRGTTPPMVIRVANDGQPMSLVGCTVALVVRDEKWEDSLTDDTARIKRRVRFWEVNARDDLDDLEAAREGDIAWVSDLAVPFLLSGRGWNPIDSAENNIPGGLYTIRFTREEVMIPVGKYYYSIDMKLPTGEITKVVKGHIKITDNTVNEI